MRLVRAPRSAQLETADRLRRGSAPARSIARWYRRRRPGIGSGPADRSGHWRRPCRTRPRSRVRARRGARRDPRLGDGLAQLLDELAPQRLGRPLAELDGTAERPPALDGAGIVAHGHDQQLIATAHDADGDWATIGCGRQVVDIQRARCREAAVSIRRAWKDHSLRPHHAGCAHLLQMQGSRDTG
jgi:hypothetical protein